MKFGSDSVFIDSWTTMRQYSAIRDILATGLNRHIKVGINVLDTNFKTFYSETLSDTVLQIVRYVVCTISVFYISSLVWLSKKYIKISRHLSENSELLMS